MNAPMDRVLARLRDCGYTPTRSGSGWSCRCPAHNDRNPSLSLNSGDDGKALIRCHAGCTVEAVCAAIGLRPSDLFDHDTRLDTGATADRRRRGDGDETFKGKSARRRNPTEPQEIRGCVAVTAPPSSGNSQHAFQSFEEAIAALERRHGARSGL
jgi:hypothetical protein